MKKNPHAVKLGKLAKGKKKRLSREEIQIRTVRLMAARIHRWKKKNEAN